MSKVANTPNVWAPAAIALNEGEVFVATFNDRPSTRYGLVAGLKHALKGGLSYKDGHAEGAKFWVGAMLRTKNVQAFTGPAFEQQGIFVKDGAITGTVNAEVLAKVFIRLIPSGVGAMEGMLGTITINDIKGKAPKPRLFGLLTESPIVRLAKQGEKHIEDGYAGAKVVLSAPTATPATAPKV